MKHKVAELEGALLDAAVAIANGYVPLSAEETRAEGFLKVEKVWRPPYGGPCLTGVPPYSQSWLDGGSIIERERIGSWFGDGVWWSDGPRPISASKEIDETGLIASGPTPLIAAMRAYVASKFGAEVELP